MFIVAVLFLVVIDACARAERIPHSNPWLLTWIPHHCCVTNDCSREVTRHDVTSLQDDHWQINASGQILKRTAHSPDGKYYRCACDYDSSAGKWIVHPMALTRCIFTPLLGF